jgi:ribosomal protein L11 methyltransferase
MSEAMWKIVTVKVPEDVFDAVSDFLATLTGRGVCTREEDNSVLIDAWLEPDKADEQLSRIQVYLGDVLDHGNTPDEAIRRVEETPEEDWMSVFRSQHHPVRISERLAFRPAWCLPIGSDDLVLDPGMAFGTGEHHTTRMCLELLDSIHGVPAGGRMLDLGTGSGILAIAGALLGFGSILAVDTDPVAVEVAAGNVRENKTHTVVRVKEGGIETAEGSYDVITANLYGSLLLELAGRISLHLAENGHLIVSGITRGEKDSTAAAFIRCGLEPVRIMERDTWVAVMFKKG